MLHIHQLTAVIGLFCDTSIPRRRYDAEQLFAPHTDTVYRSRDGVSEVSFLTVVLYLNAGYEGGELVRRT